MANSSYFQILYLHFAHSLTELYNANPLVQRIHLTLLSLNTIDTKVIFIWIPGHINLLPEDDPVERAAQQAISLRKVTDSYMVSATDF